MVHSIINSSPGFIPTNTPKESRNILYYIHVDYVKDFMYNLHSECNLSLPWTKGVVRFWPTSENIEASHPSEIKTVFFPVFI